MAEEEGGTPADLPPAPPGPPLPADDTSAEAVPSAAAAGAAGTEAEQQPAETAPPVARPDSEFSVAGSPAGRDPLPPDEFAASASPDGETSPGAAGLGGRTLSFGTVLANDADAAVSEFPEVRPDEIPEIALPPWEPPQTRAAEETAVSAGQAEDVSAVPYEVESAEDVISNMRAAVGLAPERHQQQAGEYHPAEAVPDPSEATSGRISTPGVRFSSQETPRETGQLRLPEAAEEAEEADEDDMALMDPDHPLLARVQNALREQLRAAESKLQFELREKDEAVQKAKKHREEAGVELYSVQQQLARLQAALEGARDAHGIVKGYRDEAERASKEVADMHRKEKEKLLHHKRNLDKHKDELEKVTRTLKQVDLYSGELRSRIAVTKRSTLKAEEDLVKQELEKKRLDYFIDQLQEQLHKLLESRAQYEAQLVAQQRETRAAYETLQEAATEMEAITFEKRQLLHQWKSSVVGMQRREEVMQGIEGEIEKEKSLLMALSGEIDGFKHSFRKVHEENETLTILLNKLDAEVDLLKSQIQGVTDARDKLKESYTMYGKSLAETERELVSVMQERQALMLEVASLQKQAQVQVRETSRLEEEIADRLQAQVAIEKSRQGTKRDSARTRQHIREKEAEVAKTHNDLANIRLETLETGSRIDGLKARVKELDLDLHNKNELIEKYEVEIRRRNDELGKKQSEIDILNKKYDQLTAHSQDESVGPLEATIHNLTKLLQLKERENTQLQQFWLRAQNDLVNMAKRAGELTETIQDLRMRSTVLGHKKIVVNGQYEREEKDIKDHQKNIRKLQNDMVKVNTLLSKHATAQSHLEENNLGLEQEYRSKLKEAELQSLRLEEQVVWLRAEKEQALDGLVEAERQIMLWEKKIQLARETQSALDPNVGATEIKEMGIEIHRMKLRHSALLKLQEKMILEMERSVGRRESISTKAKTKGKASGQAAVQKAIADASKRLKQTVADVRECERDVASLAESQQTVGKHLEEAVSSSQNLEARREYLRVEVARKEVERIKNTAEISIFQKKVTRLNDLRAGRYVPVVKEESARPQEAQKQKERLQKLEEIVKYLEEDHPPLKPTLGQVRAYLNASGTIATSS